LKDQQSCPFKIIKLNWEKQDLAYANATWGAEGYLMVDDYQNNRDESSAMCSVIKKSSGKEFAGAAIPK